MSVSDDVITFIKACEYNLVEVNGPDAGVDFLEADGMLFEGIGNEEEPVHLLPSNQRVKLAAEHPSIW